MTDQDTQTHPLLVHAEWLRRLAAQLVRGADGAEDVAQDAWLAVLRRPPDPARPPRPWLARVLRNLVRTRARSRRYRSERDERVSAEAQIAAALPTAEALLERHEVLRLLAGLVSELEEPFRSTVLLWCEEGLEPTEIARRQGVPAGTVRRRLKHGLDTLRAELDRRSGGDRRAWSLVLQPLASREIDWGAPGAALGKGALLMSAKTKAAAVAVGLILIAALGLWRWPGGVNPGGPASPLAPLGPVLFAPDPDVDPSLPTGAVEGTVRTAAGAPAAGATVVLVRQRPADGLEAPVVPAAVATSAAGGRFRFADVPPGAYGLTATAPGAAPARHGPFDLEARGTARVHLTLTAAGALLSGRVLDVGGGPIPGALVRAVETRGGVVVENPPRLYQTATDAAGRYGLRLPGGRYGLVAIADGYAAGLDSVHVTREVSKDLRLMPASRIAGRALERGTRRPVADADVWLAWDSLDGSRSRDVRTDSGGRFVFADVEPGSYRVTARKGELVGVGTQVSVGVAQTADGVDVELSRGVTVRGRILGVAGGLEGARVEAYKGELPPERPVLARSGAGGAYELPGLLPGRTYVSVVAPRHGRGYRLVTVASADAAGVDFQLEEEVLVSGRVRDQDGAVVRGALVEARVRPRREEPPGFGRAVTDRDGRFEMSGLMAGSLTLKAEQSGVGAVEHGPEEVNAGDKKVLELTFGGRAVLSGTVRFEDGEPAPDIEVSAIPRRGFHGWTLANAQDTTDRHGRYELLPLLPGQLIVTASRKGAVLTRETTERADRKTLALAAGETRTGFDLVVTRGGHRITGQVVAPDGSPLAFAAVAAVPERKDVQIVSRPAVTDRAITGDDGAFHLEDLDGGTHTLWVSHPAFPALRREGVAAGSRGVELRLRRGAAIEGLVVGQDSRPVADYSIVLLPGPAAGETPEQKLDRQQGGARSRPIQRVHDPSGAFAFRRLDPGSYELQVGAADGRVGSLVVTLEEGEVEADTRVRLEAGAKVTGRVVAYGSSQPFSGLNVVCTVPGGFTRTAATDAEGRFTLDGLTAGQTLAIHVMPDPRRHVADSWSFEIPTGRKELDAGTLRLVPGDLEAKQAALNRAVYGSLGLTATGRNGRATIVEVEAGLPAGKGGMKKGDLLLTIDGHDVHDLGYSGVRWFMIGVAGKPVTFELETGPARARRKVTVTRVARDR